MLLLSYFPDGGWGICEEPIARRENRPMPSAWSGLAGGAMHVPKRAAHEPETLPPWPSREWDDWERKLVARFREVSPHSLTPDGIPQWLHIEFAPTGTTGVPLVKPTQRLLNFMAAFLADGGEDKPVIQTAGPKVF